ncbi:uncharacterized protein CC84DRAFT_1159090 [Paraphaeosphaeria sporulosa]|uniref:Uncharacterized protein n=1 Tax=Paraphaeosphaeria sporulosa TaxID=1460663 RepID=A0A177CY16_9PLEO|nr:uncharacterized protein CC84DRAFT_1159090 [Paraphaeosphaeria sporulosa]OAG11599.1 hypothetical protein CC84DRAFT_1159090 [Paraphaeosphaeria sporulosa]
MADVRSMLKQQRAARQQAKAPKQSAPTSKKRKAVEDTPEERKRTRTEEQAGVPAGFFDEGAAQEAEATPPDAEAPAAAPTEDTLQQPDATKPPLPAADDELDAFMAEMDQAAAEPQHNPASYSGAVIESAPMTAAQLAAQAKEDKTAQRARNDEEMEDEKEDAANALQDEFEEMDGLEERVKKLREQREALRVKHAATDVREETVPLPALQPEDEDSVSEDDDWDDWRFRPA